ncbi:glycosyltransferase [Paenibacillus sp. N1-5-1-14]|uniref:glycosyltransferase n=1 Tax=Paenibacillus radicibacter TaxID=2972488 RepID=UPI0021590094|nr:glycosyltransferase [Paenibacillus radicibacter]MCR8641086.1 glycosyltransferase [Paenibacillus radicibacter]
MMNFIMFKDILLYATDTYFHIIAEDMGQFLPIYVGSRRIREDLPLDEKRIKVLNKGTWFGWLREAVFKTTGLAFGLIRALKPYKPAFIHAHYGFGGVLSLPIQRSLNIPLIVTFHGHDATAKDEADNEYYTHRLYVRKRKILQERAALFLAVSDFIKSKMIAQGYPEHKIVTHYLGIDLDFFKPDPTIPRKQLVLFVGRLVENKGGEYLIRAMEQVQQSSPETELIVIGEGDLREALEVQAEYSLTNYQFIGTQSQESVRAWLNQAKVLCVPSITIESGKSEGFGQVFIEANAMGVPVVSFATGGIPEAVEHGKTGYLLPERDWSGLAKHILLLIQSESLWQQFSEQGMKRVSAEFNLSIQKKKLEHIYDQFLIRDSSM